MSSLIDFILSNLFFVIIIGGAILNMIKRFSDAGKEPNKKYPTKPINGAPKKQVKEIFDQFEDLFKEKTPEPQTINKLETIMDVKDIIMPVEKEPVTTISTLPSKTQVGNKQTSISSHSGTFVNNKVVDGIVWSEVLGPPRAKRPFNSRK